jgi:flagellar biosynthesis protein FlhF
MQIKRYDALSISEAMQKIKADIGPDAIVLSSRRLNGRIEVIAARDDNYEILKENEVEPQKRAKASESENSKLPYGRRLPAFLTVEDCPQQAAGSFKNAKKRN